MKSCAALAAIRTSAAGSFGVEGRRVAGLRTSSRSTTRESRTACVPGHALLAGEDLRRCCARGPLERRLATRSSPSGVRARRRARRVGWSSEVSPQSPRDARSHVYLTEFGQHAARAPPTSGPSRCWGRCTTFAEQIRARRVGVRPTCPPPGAMLFPHAPGGVQSRRTRRGGCGRISPSAARAGRAAAAPRRVRRRSRRAMSKDPGGPIASAGELSGPRSPRSARRPPARAPRRRSPRPPPTRAVADPFSLAVAGRSASRISFGGLSPPLQMPWPSTAGRAGPTSTRRAARRCGRGSSPRPALRRRAGGGTDAPEPAGQTGAIHDASEAPGLPYTEVAAEVDRLVATMKEPREGAAAARACGTRRPRPSRTARARQGGRDPAKPSSFTALPTRECSAA